MEKKTNEKTSSGLSSQEGTHDIKWWFEIVGIGFEIVGIGVAVWVAFLVLFQYKEMVKSTKVFESQLREMQQTRILDERAWVAASDVGIGHPENGFIRFTITFRNTGKTPAINSQINILSQADINKIPLKEEPIFPRRSAAMLAPNGTHFTYLDLPVEALKVVGVGYLYGTVWYDDIFGTHHWSQFCYVVNCDTNLNIAVGPAAIHNSCDDAATNRTN